MTFNISKTDDNSFYNFLMKGISLNQDIYNILLALWHLNISPINGQLFPEELLYLFEPQVKTIELGIDLLKKMSTTNANACYLLAKYYLNSENILNNLE